MNWGRFNKYAINSTSNHCFRCIHCSESRLVFIQKAFAHSRKQRHMSGHGVWAQYVVYAAPTYAHSQIDMEFCLLAKCTKLRAWLPDADA